MNKINWKGAWRKDITATQAQVGRFRLDAWFRAESLGDQAWKWTIRNPDVSFLSLAEGFGKTLDQCKIDAEKAFEEIVK